MKNGHSEIVFLLDMTGSMSNLVKDVVGGFNVFVEDQKKQPGTAKLSLIVFNSDVYKTILTDDLSKIRQITENDYRPSGMTPLLDAVGTTIDDVGARLNVMEEKDRPEHVIFVIMTDGEENFSKKFSLKEVADKVKLQQDTYKWNFIFMGANIDSFADASKLGIIYDPKFQNVANFAADATGVLCSYSSSSSSTSSYRASKTT